MLPDEITVHFKFSPKLWLVSPLAVLAVFGLINLPWDSVSAPSWVQAIGSVGAIGVAIYLASLQERRRIERDQRVDVEYLKKVVAVSKHVGDVLAATLEVMQENSDHFALQELRLALEDNLALMQEIGFGSIPGSEAGLGWIELRRSLKRTIVSLNLAIKSPSFGEEDLNNARIVVGHGMQAVARIRKSAAGRLPALTL